MATFAPCTNCQVDRLESTLDVNGLCPFCAELPAAQAPEATKTHRKRTTRVKIAPTNASAGPADAPLRPSSATDEVQPSPVAPTASISPVRQSSGDRYKDAETADAVLSMPYEPPRFDILKAQRSPEQELAFRQLARRRLMPFIQRFRPKYTAGWVHHDICRRLERFIQQVAEKKSPRLLLMCPPRSGKSEIASRHLAPWVLGQYPDWEIIAASHTASLSLSFSRYIRDLLRDPAYQAVFPDAILDPQSQSVENWNLTQAGGYLAAGVGTGITGRGCLTPYSNIDTPSGIMPIINIKVGDLVYGYQPAHQAVVATRVKAVQVTQRQAALLTHGNTTLTTDHRIYHADTDTYITAGESQNLSGLWREEGSARGVVQELSFEAADERSHSTQMQLLWEELRTRQVGASEVSGSTRGGGQNFLFSHLLRQVQGVASGVVQQGQRFMCALFKAADRIREEQVLQLRLLLGIPITASADGILRRGVSGAEVKDHQTRRKVHDVRFDEFTVRGASHQRGRNEQSGEELDLSVRGVSPQISSTYGTCAADLAGAFSEVDFVVDIQTETGNFFTSGFLVHNCHILLLDDLVKDIESADSPTITDNTWEWYGSTAYTRLAPGGGVLGVMTWWSESDWAGRIQSTMKTGDGDMFEIVKYPAINEEGDEYILPDDTIAQFGPLDDAPPTGSRLTRPMGTALHPERYDTEAMLRIKRNLIATGQKRVWQALYQQNPVPDDGLFFTKDMFKYAPSLPPANRCHIYQAWDFAISEGTESDYTVGVTLYQDDHDNLYVADVRRFRSSDSIYIVDTILDYALEHSATLIGVEDGQIWKTMDAQFQKRCAERRHYPSFEVLKPLTDKMVRAHPLRGRMQAGKIWFLQKAGWFAETYNEMTRFPAGKHDDIIDALAWCVRLTLGRHAPKPLVRKERVKSWKDGVVGMGGKRQGGHMSA